MFERILIATDNSPLMRNAIQYTGRAFPFADYHLINVINTTDGSIPHTPLMRRHLKGISRDALEKGRVMLEEMGINDIKLAMPGGTPSKEIMRYTTANNIDLIVLATHSKIGSQRVHIGETARNSLQITHIPALVFSCRCEPVIPKRIINISSFSKYSVEATTLAIELAKHFGAKLTTYHIGKNDPGAAGDRLTGLARKKGVDFDIIIDKGATDEKILERAKGYDLTIASRGRGGLKYKLRFLFPHLALSDLEKELIAEVSTPFLMVGD